MEACTVLRGEPGYPRALERIPRPPARLRLRGRLTGRRHVAVVGARRTDAYGIDMAEVLSAGLARAGVAVVSGGAEGVDGAAHRAALDAGGHTVAVFGCGVDVAYPAGHRALFERIVEQGGALLSEYDDGTPPDRFRFPDRNRIVAGLCEAVVVVRAGRGSGALITAEWARRAGIPVHAVPGDAALVLSSGPHRLIRAGARLVSSPADLLDDLGLAAAAAERAADLEGEAGAMYRALGAEPRHADELAKRSGLAPGAALAALLELELGGLAEQRPGQYFLRRGAGAARP